jgi:hypothetical protein
MLCRKVQVPIADSFSSTFPKYFGAVLPDIGSGSALPFPEVDMSFSEPTLPSLTSRQLSLKDRHVCRGFAVYQNRLLVFESHLELMVFYLLAMLPGVATIFDQPKAVEYIDDAGRLRHHTFDFLIVMHDGTRIYIAVKPSARVIKSGIQHTIELIAGQLPVGTADSIKLITDADFTRADRFNASQAFECSRFPIAEHDDLVDRITAEMIGAVRINDLVEVSGVGGGAFRAVVRLISRGIFAPAATGRITPESYVVRVFK